MKTDMKLEELKRLTNPIYIEGDPIGEERIAVLKRMTANGIPHNEEPNIMERLKAMVGLDERSKCVGILAAASNRTIG